MYKNHRVICVTPAGRRHCLEILLKHTLSLRYLIDEHHLWLNTDIPEDLNYMRKMRNKYPHFIKLIKPTIAPAGHRPYTIYQFFYYCVDPNTIYLRLDDDICYLSHVENLFDYLLETPQLFIAFPLIINNWMCEWIPSLRSMQYHAWTDEAHHHNHKTFFRKIKEKTGVTGYFTENHLLGHRDANVNAMCWLGPTLKHQRPPAHGAGEERWFLDYPREILQRPSGVCGTSLAVHFSFQHQGIDGRLLEHTNYLQRYNTLAPTFPMGARLF